MRACRFHPARCKPITLAVVGALATLQWGSAFAQQSDLKTSVMADVTVTAQAETTPESGFRPTRSSASGFRDKPVLDTPFSVNAVTAEVILDQQARTLTDVVKNDPSVSLATDPLFFDRVRVRGFTLSVDAIKRDGLSINDQGTIALQNKAAVEIYKGLSGMRYGATSPGGVINYVVKRPTATPLSRVTFDANDDGGASVAGDFSRRFGAQNQFGVRVNAAAEKQRNHIDAFRGDSGFFSTALEWQATDRLLLELDVEHLNYERNEPGTPSVRWWGNNLARAQAAFPGIDARTFASQDWARVPNRQNYYAARAHYQFSDSWKASVSALRSKLSRDQASVTPTNVQPNGEHGTALYFSPDQERNNSSWQLVVEGDVRTGSLKHELAFGADSVRRDMVYGPGFEGDVGSGNLFNPRPLPRPTPVTGPSYLANRTDQDSMFVTDTITFPGGFQVFGGVRRNTLEIREGSAPNVIRQTYDKTATVPSLGVLYKPASNVSLYASYSEGIEQGGTAPSDAANRNEVLKPLESRQGEIGAKVELAPNALLTAAVFRIDKGLEYINAANLYVQDGSQVHEGAELTLSGQIGPRLRVIAGTAYLKASVRETANRALIGKRPQGVPRWQANLYADYDLQAVLPGLPGLSVNGGIYYGGDKAIDAANTWLADSYVRVDAGVRYRHAIAGGKLVTLRVGVENLTDRRYLANTTSGALTFGMPRSVKGSLAIDF